MSVALLLALLVAQSVSGPFTAEERYVAELRARIAKGDVEAEVALGNLYESGESVLPLDPAQAAEWYRRAADKGHAGAQMNLAYALAATIASGDAFVDAFLPKRAEDPAIWDLVGRIEPREDEDLERRITERRTMRATKLELIDTAGRLQTLRGTPG